MTAVIFDITKPPIGEVGISLRHKQFNDVKGLDGVKSLGTEGQGAEHYAIVSFWV